MAYSVQFVLKKVTKKGGKCLIDNDHSLVALLLDGTFVISTYVGGRFSTQNLSIFAISEIVLLSSEHTSRRNRCARDITQRVLYQAIHKFLRFLDPINKQGVHVLICADNQDFIQRKRNAVVTLRMQRVGIL